MGLNLSGFCSKTHVKWSRVVHTSYELNHRVESLRTLVKGQLCVPSYNLKPMPFKCLHIKLELVTFLYKSKNLYYYIILKLYISPFMLYF